ncbi:MAG: 2-oxo acid dehydrogenase subunit E2 [Chitinophagales bacterium]|nr:2-oxo acid dehydrogenase subunit E2 [Chitinophagales bacterium]MCZ2394019.1 2-oxo acid dehydrogenase subunit E2 [Chitinophagales bacterium]
MAEFQLTMPKMGESVIEATILTWNKKPGDSILENDIILEVATDKVDSEVPSPISGVLKEILFKENDIVAVDQVIAIIETDQPISSKPAKEVKNVVIEELENRLEEKQNEEIIVNESEDAALYLLNPKITPSIPQQNPKNSERFYSPLVLNIAKTENISMAELDTIIGSGAEGRVNKDDVLKYLEIRNTQPKTIVNKASSFNQQLPVKIPSDPKESNSIGDEIIEMDRMRKLISRNMLESKRISAHVSSFVEVNMTNVVKWREKHKDSFKKREGFNLTYMPIFTDAIAKAIKDFPMINISVDGEKIIKKKNINIGIATALPSGNLIVPIVKNADRMNLIGLATTINQLSDKARNNQLTASDIEGGTYTISNIGTFGNILGTPIIPQPQVAIMAVGAITKKPVVIETEHGDLIAIQHMMYLSHTYDHRVVDGALGGMFVKRVAEYLENFDIHQDI